MICMFTGRHVTALSELIGADQVAAIEAAEGVNLMDEADRYKARHALRAALEGWISTRNFAEVAEGLDKSGSLWGPYKSFSDMAADAASHPMFSID